MIKDNNNDKHFNADDGKTFVNKVSGVRYGNDLYLCDEDSIKNYTEEAMTEEELALIEEQKNASKPAENKGKKKH